MSEVQRVWEESPDPGSKQLSYRSCAEVFACSDPREEQEAFSASLDQSVQRVGPTLARARLWPGLQQHTVTVTTTPRPRSDQLIRGTGIDYYITARN